MKKLLSVLIVLIMVLCASALAEDLSGIWYLTEGIMGDMSLNLAAMGMDIVITLNADGTATMISSYGESSDEQSGTWTATETGLVINANEGATEFVLEDGKLRLDMGDEGAMIFGREKPEAVELPAPVAAESEDVFLGTWTATNVSMMGMVMPADLAGMSFTMTVAPGKVSMDSGDGNPDEMEAAFADGALVLTSDGKEEGKLLLNEDGTVCVEIALGDEGVMGIYFAKAE